MGLRKRLKSLRSGGSARSREGVSSARAERVAREARAVLAATRAASGKLRKPAELEERDAVEAAGRAASARGPVDAGMEPTSGIEQLHTIAGGEPREMAPLDEFVVGASGSGGEAGGGGSLEGLVYGDDDGGDPLAVEVDLMGSGGER
jgi:hypothetical protein